MPSLTEDEINSLHKQEFKDAAEEFGGMFRIPFDRVMQIGSNTRERWCQFVAERDGQVTDPSRRHDKTAKLIAALRSNVGRVVTIADLQDMGECSRSTAYDFLADNRSQFRKVGNGQFEIIDTDAARAADKAKPIREDIAIIDVALNVMNGQGAAA
jgi:hypothetical protein